MSFVPNGTGYSKCCRECGRVGVTRHDCPNHPCNFCKKHGHVATSCPKLELRRHRQQQQLKGSSPSNSPDGTNNLQPPAKRPPQNPSLSNTSSAPHGTNNLEPPAKRPRQNSSSSNTSSAPSPDGQSKAELSSIDIELATQALDIRNETYLPPLLPLASHVIQILSSDASPKPFLPFKPQIARYSSTTILADIIPAIDTTIRALEGHIIDLHTLQKVREIQKRDYSLFDYDGGYLNFITDTRSDTYFKMYIGQGQVLADRVGQHRSNIAMGDMTTLHYFILATGATFRSANFIRLFCLKSEIFHDEEYAALCRNLLEFVMTLAFQTLPKPELKQWLPEASIKTSLETLHLNVLNPLYQGLRESVTFHTRHSTRDMLFASPDPQLARWPVVRKQQLADQEIQRTTNRGPYPKLHQMGDILRDTIDENRPLLGELAALQFPLQAQIGSSRSLSMHDRLDQLRTQLCINETSSPLEKLYTPVGSVESPLAMVLNQALIPPKYDQPDSPDSLLPLTFEEMGLTDGQILIWPFNLHHRSSFTQEDLPSKGNDEAEAFKMFSFELLNDSRAHFILVAEGVAEESIFQDNPLLSAKFELTLRSFKIKARVQIRGNEVQRVFLIIPDPETLFFQGNFRACQRFTHTLRMAGYLSGVKGQKWRMFEHKGAHTMILRAYAANDLDSVSLNTLDHHIVEWLHRKGFQTAEDVRELQDLSPTKSLIEACFMLMVLIPKHYTDVDRKVFEVKAKRSKKPKPRTIPEEIASAIRQFFEKKLSIMLGENRVQPHLPHSSKPLEIESTLIDGNAVQPHIETELDSESYDPIEGDTAEILPLLEDGSKTRHWMPNPVGVGLSQTLASVGGNNTWARKREETATGLLTGTRSFYPVTGKRTPYISLAGWTVSIIVSFPVSEKSAVFVKAEISPPGTRHEHTCFDSSPARLSRLAFRIKTVSSNGESFFWAQRVEFEKQEMLEKLFDRLSSESDGNRATNSSE